MSSTLSVLIDVHVSLFLKQRQKQIVNMSGESQKERKTDNTYKETEREMD